jgi:hypothetical protein
MAASSIVLTSSAFGRVPKYAGVRQSMTDIFERNYRCYGYRRLRACLRDQCVNISEKVVRRLMKQECLVAATSKRRRYGSYMGEISPAPDSRFRHRSQSRQTLNRPPLPPIGLVHSAR